MTTTKKQRRERGLDRPAPKPKAGRLPWKPRDIFRHHEDGSTELLRWSIVDADGREVVADFESEDVRNGVVAAVNRSPSAFGSTDPRALYLDPYSIVQDAVEILPVVLAGHEESTGEKDEIARDLLKRIRKATKGAK